MCNCGKSRAATQRRIATPETTSRDATQAFSLIPRDGSAPESFGSRLEADAANARAGYTGIVRQNSEEVRSS